MRAETTLPDSLMSALDREVGDWEDGEKLARLWSGDPALWTGADEADWLGWLRIPTRPIADADRLDCLSPLGLGRDFDDILLLGMGGSSLCPDVLRASFGDVTGAPRLHVIDSTDPAQIRAAEQRVALDRTLFIVSSKSGTTLESRLLMEYFLGRVQERIATGRVGERFVAVTDPGSALEKVALARGFREVFHGLPSIGGRYSALSDFGIVPAAAMGLDVETLLRRADRMRARCLDIVPVPTNPGAMLGLALGVAARAGRDKLTVVASPAIQRFGAWVEQLVAESTGKQGRGVIPVDGEALGSPKEYAADRIFVYIRDEEGFDPRHDAALDRLADSGHPVLRIAIQDRYDLGAEFFRWEFATSVLGAVLRVNPFDQPDVEASKVATRELTQAHEMDAGLPTPTALAEDRDAGLTVFADAANAAALGRKTGGVGDIIDAHCGRLVAGDYFAILAYVEMSPVHVSLLQVLRHRVRDATGNATTVGFGPRYLHSTGQAHKGGQNTGLFLQITCDDADDIDVPGRGYTFGVVKAAQAQGDLAVLGSRGRRVIRLHITGDVQRGLQHISALVGQSVQRRH